MRCKNCGFPNRPEETECLKCHAPLIQGGEPNNSHSASNHDVNATIPESLVFQEIEENVCPKCGYPLRENSSRCPNCNYAITTSGSRQQNQFNHSQEYMENPANESSRLAGTFNPYKMEMESKPGFVLRPIIRQKEKKEVADLNYEGKEVVLNRNNTEYENASITSQNQAMVSFIEGHWYIEDKSDQGTTFVRAQSKIELHEGDTILLGNRLFEFHLPEDK